MAVPFFRPSPSQARLVEPFDEGEFARVHVTQRRDAQPKVAASAARKKTAQDFFIGHLRGVVARATSRGDGLRAVADDEQRRLVERRGVRANPPDRRA